MEKKLINISYIKVIIMLVIVLYHSMLFFNGEWFVYQTPIFKADYLKYIANWLNTFHVQTFCMVSGFLFYYLKIEKGRYNNPIKDIKKRSKRLLIPYIFTSVFWVIPIAIYFNNYSALDIIKKFVLMESPNQLWFLIMLFLVFVFFELFSNKIRISFKNLFIIFILSTGLGFTLQLFDINYFQISKAVQYIIYFYLGGYIYKNKDKTSIKQIVLMLLMFILLYGICLYFNYLDIFVLNCLSKFILTIVSICEVSIIYYIITKAVEKKKLKTNNIIYKLVDENNFGIYLFHQQIIYFMIVLLNGVVHPIIQVIASFVVALIISILMTVILRKNKVTKTMFGV